MVTRKILSFLVVAFFCIATLKAQVNPPVKVKTPVTKIPVVEKAAFGTLADVEGNSYKIIRIGTQTWMAENLKASKLNDGTPIELVNGTPWSSENPRYCWYNPNSPNEFNKYGGLYNWYAVNTGKLCPAGWRVPSEADWKTLESYLIANGYNWNGQPGPYYGKALGATTDWKFINFPGAVGNTDYPDFRNKSGFTALPAGRRSAPGASGSMGEAAAWWTSTTSGSSGRQVMLMYNGNSFSISNQNKFDGLSIRCIKN